MKCPKCGASKWQSVIDSRPREWGIKRIRHCANCQYRYATGEVHTFSKQALNDIIESQLAIDMRTNKRS
jgi:transcriptional regulator NrdR family protein